MATNFPTSLDTLTNPITTNQLNSPSHAGQHSDANDAIEALEAKVGANSSAVNTTHDYKLSDVATGSKAETSANKKTDLTDNSDTYYPSQKAVKTAVDAKIDKTTLDAASVLGANTDNTPVAVVLSTNSVLGRIAGDLVPVPIDSDLSSVSAGDDTVPSAKATKAMGDAKALLAGSVSQAFSVSQLEVGHASDTTITRVSAGKIAVEGVNVVTTSSTDVLSNKTLSGDVPLEENAAIKHDNALSADGKYTGEVIDGTAGAALAFGDLVYLDPTDSRWELADANVITAADGDCRGILAICVLAAAGDGSATKLLLRGMVRADAAFPTLTVNNKVYVSETSGDITETQPTTADVAIRVVGFGFDANTLYFCPSNDYITHA